MHSKTTARGADLPGRPRGGLGRFAAGQSGAVSVEYAIWLPLLLAVGLMIADASAALITHASMWRTAGDVARPLAIGRLSIAEAQGVVAASVSGVSASVERAGDIVIVRLTKPFSEVGTGLFLLPFGELRVELRQMLEPHVSLLN